MCSSHLSEPCFWGFIWIPFRCRPVWLLPGYPIFTACLARFKLGRHVSVGSCRRLLGLMAAASPVLPLGLLHMRPFLWWMKELRLRPTVPATRLIRVSRGCSRPLLQWRDPAFLWSGVRIGAIHRRHMVTTDASMTGWGAVFEGRPASGDWTGEFLSWHINCLELRAVLLASYHSQDGQHGGCVPHKPSRRFTVAHLGQACAPSSPLVPVQVPFLEDSSRSGNTEPRSRLSVKTETQAGRMDVEPSDNIPDLGSVWQSGGGPLCFSRVIPMPALVLPEFPDDSGHRCVRPLLYAFPPIKLIPAILCRVKVSSARLLLIAPFWPSQTWFSELTSLLYWPLGRFRSGGTYCPSSRAGSGIPTTRALEVVGMAHSGPRAVMDVLPVKVQETSARAPATRKLYSSKWGVFESWCLSRAIDPVNCPVGPVLEFLQERMTAGAAATTLRVYVAAISARRELDEIPLGRHRLVSALCMESDGLGQLAPRQFLLGTYQSSSKVW